MVVHERASGHHGPSRSPLGGGTMTTPGQLCREEEHREMTRVRPSNDLVECRSVYVGMKSSQHGAGGGGQQCTGKGLRGDSVPERGETGRSWPRQHNC